MSIMLFELKRLLDLTNCYGVSTVGAKQKKSVFL